MTSSVVIVLFFFQAEDGIRDLVRSRGLGDVYKRQPRGHDQTDEEHHRVGVQPGDGARVQAEARRGVGLSLIHI